MYQEIKDDIHERINEVKRDIRNRKEGIRDADIDIEESLRRKAYATHIIDQSEKKLVELEEALVKLN